VKEESVAEGDGDGEAKARSSATRSWRE